MNFTYIKNFVVSTNNSFNIKPFITIRNLLSGKKKTNCVTPSIAKAVKQIDKLLAIGNDQDRYRAELLLKHIHDQKNDNTQAVQILVKAIRNSGTNTSSNKWNALGIPLSRQAVNIKYKITPRKRIWKNKTTTRNQGDVCIKQALKIAIEEIDDEDILAKLPTQYAHDTQQLYNQLSNIKCKVAQNTQTLIIKKENIAEKFAIFIQIC